MLSRYVLTIEDVRPGEHVLYDVIGDRYVGVDERGLEMASGWRQGRAPQGGAEAELADALASAGFLVRSAEEDEARLTAFMADAAEGEAGTAFVTLMPTLSCNLACTYCLQKDHPAAGRMNEATEAAALAYVERHVVATEASRLVIHYIGGEPLLRKDFVLRTGRQLAARMEELEIDFAWKITTNGLELEPAFVAEMLHLGSGTVSVTVDGDRVTHDLARIHRDGSGSFDAVFDAITRVASECPQVKLETISNVRADQADSCERFMEGLVASGLAGRFEQNRFKTIIDLGAGCGQACGAEADEDFSRRMSVRAHERGLARQRPPGVDGIGPCDIHHRRALVIDPAGRVYRCFAVAGRPEMALGTVHDLGAPLAPDPLIAARPLTQCSSDCPFVPICVGGCLATAYLRIGRPGQPMCERTALEHRFRAEIKSRYLEEFYADETREVDAPIANEASVAV